VAALMAMFERILIANRGEIACRVMHTARRLGIATVAVYSDADAGALHVTLADEAIRIGPAPARESYLRIDAIIAAAKRSGAEAIHPGYGFLSENAAFAEACASAGIVFIGPQAAAIRAMGSKSEAKALMAKAGVPLVPGYHGADQADAVLREAAASVGYPVLIKASAGGGGKGMRRVDRPEEFAAALAGARREAASAFGDDRMLIERYLIQPRHVEIQVFADGQGNVLHLFERDCSVQRRHQKVIEEAPAPGMSIARRRAMGETAVAAARAIAYVGAGTVEFILDADGAFYFMEMNTRLQVEHPVTEKITGHDLVEWQLRVAAGETLPVGQADLAIGGHAFEARLYAEDPAHEFLPAAGRLTRLVFPPSGHDLPVRVDSGVRQGDDIGVHYDPLIAKLIAWGDDREAARRRLVRALEECRIAGLKTNRDFLIALAGHPAFAAGAVHTGFIEQHRATLLPAPRDADDRALAAATLWLILARQEAACQAAGASADPTSPWHVADGWRLNLAGYDIFTFVDGDARIAVTAHYRRDGLLLDLPGGSQSVAASRTEDGLRLTYENRQVPVTILAENDALTVVIEKATYRLCIEDRLAAAESVVAGGGRLTAPMPGKIVQVAVKPGDVVERGAALMVLEAMKMEHTIAAPAAGIVGELLYAAGDLVEEGAELLLLEVKA
jgi:3-methylcrotonyl-CoA carboxylase alpha subunit